MEQLKNFETSAGAATPYFYGLISYAFTCVANLQVKYLPALPAMQLCFLRNCQFAIYGYSHLRHMGAAHCPKVDPKLIRTLLFRCLLGSLGVFFHFFAVKRLPLSEFVVMYQTVPMFTSVMAALILKEKFELKQGVSILLCMVGVILIVKPPILFGNTLDRSPSYMWGAASVICAALVDSYVLILIRQLGSKVPNPLIVFYFGIIGACFSAIGMIALGIGEINFSDIIHIAILGSFYYLMQIIRNRAYTLGEAGKVSITASSEVVYSLIADILLFNYSPDKWSKLGSCIIVGCVLIMIIGRLRK